MLKIFRSNHLVTGVLLIFYAVLIRSAVFVLHSDINTPESTGILSSFIYGFSGAAGMIPDILSTTIIFINALIINYLVARNFLSKELNLFPGLFYILVSSSVPDFLSFSALHLANTFLILSVFSLFKIYKKPQSAKHIFNAALLIGISSLFNFSYWIFFGWLLIAINTLQSLKIKKIFMVSTGFLLPWFYVFLYYYWIGTTQELFANHIQNQFQFLTFHLGNNLFNYMQLIILPILILTVLFRFRSNFIKQSFEVKKKISLLYWLLLFSSFYLLTGIGITPEHLLVFTVPTGILLSFSFTRMSPPYDGIIHFFLLVIIVLIQYLTFLRFL